MQKEMKLKMEMEQGVRMKMVEELVEMAIVTLIVTLSFQPVTNPSNSSIIIHHS